MRHSWVLLLLLGACNEALVRPPGGNHPIDPVEPGPSYLRFSRMPGSAPAGKPIEPIQVLVVLSSGNIDRSFTGLITISAQRLEAPAPVRGTLSVRAVEGIAGFNDLVIDYPGVGYRWSASAPDLPTVVSEPFAIGITCPPSGCQTPVLAFASCLEWDWDADLIEVCVSNGLTILDASGVERIVATSPFGFADPAWSPDGTRIAYTASDGCEAFPLSGCAASIFIIDADGSNRRRFPIEVPGNGGSSGASWSPDGARIAFEVWRPAEERQDLYVMNADGSGLARLGGLEGGNPAWSPDGTRLAFDRRDATGQWSIYSAASDGSRMIRLTASDAALGVRINDFKPAWSHDGRRIAFTRAWQSSEGQSSCQVMVMDADGSKVAQLTLDDFCSRSPVWSPDGATIAFIGSPPGSQRLGIMLMNADGSGAGLLRAVMADFPRVTWYPGR